MQTKSEWGGGGGALVHLPPAPTTLSLTEGKEWKGVLIEKIRGSILLFCREKRGRQEEEGSVIRLLVQIKS